MKLKIIKEYIKLKRAGFDKDIRYIYYAKKGLITFDEYDKFITKKFQKNKTDFEKHIPYID